MKQPYIHSNVVDGIFILFPPFFCLLLVALLPQYFGHNIEVTGVSWLILVVFIDVAHVYSTMFRTYLDREMVNKFKSVFYGIPVLVFVLGVLLYTSSHLWFWRMMAYLAVFHFVRQQYGFMRLYERKDSLSSFKRIVDGIAIYSATIFPLLYWHFTSSKVFRWFVKDDFIFMQNQNLLTLFSYLYIVILFLYVLTELQYSRKYKYINIPKNILLLGTALSWYIGIVVLNSDMSFTLLNVVAHGIPYMALIWIKGKEKMHTNPNNFSRMVKLALTGVGIPLFLLFMLVPAVLEEGIWDVFIWHEQIESIFDYSLEIPITKSIDNLLVPLLVVPQVTHYVLDGFIWRVSKDSNLSH